MKKIVLAAIVVFLIASVNVTKAQNQERIGVHDPVMIQENDTWYLFCTGMGISAFSSPDLINWTQLDPVFAEAPAWVAEEIPTFRGNHIWAPDIYYHDGLYYLNYSCSAFGRNTSCIGVATNKTLDPNDPDFEWVDHGKLIKSDPGVTDWNAIDGNFLIDAEGTPWLTFGSFWSGMQQIKLKPNLLELDGDRSDCKLIASRRTKEEMEKNSEEGPSANAGSSSIEAPFLWQEGDFYYLFVSWDRCCAGAQSTYKVAIGRSENPDGPFVDMDGKPMLYGGGTVILEGDETDWYAQGHNGVARDEGTGQVYLVTHAYDRHSERAASKLRIIELNWNDEGWPEVGEEVR
ncbi:MAG TPA: family 43 glycosylhydrolase [Draconibacterium sp.]|nr:family 43 glycosylhydrolase [Draconibacterium sp.]